jgi:hypothetical protein
MIKVTSETRFPNCDDGTVVLGKLIVAAVDRINCEDDDWIALGPTLDANVYFEDDEVWVTLYPVANGYTNTQNPLWGITGMWVADEATQDERIGQVIRDALPTGDMPQEFCVRLGKGIIAGQTSRWPTFMQSLLELSKGANNA